MSPDDKKELESSLPKLTNEQLTEKLKNIILQLKGLSRPDCVKLIHAVTDIVDEKTVFNPVGLLTYRSVLSETFPPKNILQHLQ